MWNIGNVLLYEGYDNYNKMNVRVVWRIVSITASYDMFCERGYYYTSEILESNVENQKGGIFSLKKGSIVHVDLGTPIEIKSKPYLKYKVDRIMKFLENEDETENW
jgi:hypothetical protein